MSKCTCSAWPFISTSCAWKSLQTFSNMTLSRWRASPSNTCLRYFVTKTKWACNAKTQCLPRRISFVNCIDQEYDALRCDCKHANSALRPNGEQIRNLRQFAGSCRFIYNKALALNVERYETKQKRLGYAGLCALLPNWKMEHEFLSAVPAQALQQALKNLERAYANFFQKRADFPKFKKKGQRESFRIPQGFEVDKQNGRIKLPKLGWMRYRKSQDILGEASNVTVSESCGTWFVSIQTEREVQTPQHPAISAVGLDWGVVNFVTLSDGGVVEQCQPLKTFLPKLAKLQRHMERKEKFSKN